MITCRRCLLALLTGLLLAPDLAADCPTRGLTPIHELRGESGAALEGERVLLRGVVTGDFRGEERLNGFYLQARETHEEPVRGIFVYAPDIDPGAEPIAPGREVLVSGQAGEFRGQRQVSRVRQVLHCGEPGLPEALPLALPKADRSHWKKLEGRLVHIDQPLTVTGNFHLARYGSLELSVGGRLFRATNFHPPRTGDKPARRIVLDDASYRAHPAPIPYLNEAGTRRTGSRIPQLTGILTHAFDDWRIHPLSPASIRFEESNPRPAPPERTDGPRLAAFNVENYFLSLGQRGADDERMLAAQQAALAEVSAGLDADLLGLIEIENDPAAVADLVERLGEAAASGAYRHFELDRPVGSDAIRVALAWREDQVELLAGPFIDEDPVHHRPPVVGHFRFDDSGPGKLVAVIHHKAKSGCPDEGDVDRGQGCWNERRSRQSRALKRFLTDKAETLGTDRILVMGDINSYGGEDPVRVLSENDWTDLVAEQLPPEQRYSYVFRGESGYLDTALATTVLADDVDRVRFWHINADEPAFLQFRQPGPWRSSDHDPVVIDFKSP